jgi:hypothetical protein
MTRSGLPFSPRWANASPFRNWLDKLMSASWEDARRESRIARNAGGGPLWHFLRGFIKHPVMVGAAVPSSKVTVDKVLSRVDWSQCKLFVEYGPGVGTFTEHVLNRMAPDATLIAIDTNEDFTRYLRSKFTDNRLFAVTGSAEDVRQIVADCLVRPALLHPAARRRAEDRGGDGGGAAAWRLLHGVSVQGEGARLHGSLFRPHRPGSGMAECAAMSDLLGL